jgi:hypothetical protein
MSQIRHRWVTEPALYSKEITTILAAIPQPSLFTTPMSAGRVRYETVATIPESLKPLLIQISYIPLTLSVPTSAPADMTYARWLEGIQNILRARIWELTGIPVSSFGVAIYENPDMVLLSPMTHRGLWDVESAIYVGPREIDAVVTECHIPKIWGYDLLSTSPLTGYILPQILPVSANWDVRTLGSLTLTRIPSSTIDTLGFTTEGSSQQYLNYLDTKTRIQLRTQALTQEGYFAIPLESETDLSLQHEIAALWATRIVTLTSIPPLVPTALNFPQLILETNASSLLNLATEVWWKRALLEIKDELFPSVLIAGSWMEGAESTGVNRAKLLYAAIRTLAQVAFSNPWVLRYASRLRVGDDLTISVMLSRIEEVTEFLQKFNFYLDSAATWTVIGFQNDAEALTMRWKIATQYYDLHPLLVKVPRNGTYLVVDTLTTTSIFRDSPTPFLVTPEEIDSLKQKIQTIQTELPLKHLPESASLVDLVESMATVDYLDPIVGWYTIGPIPGLFTTLPIPPPVDLSADSIRILGETQIKTVLVETTDGRGIELFSIWSDETKELQQLSHTLWARGWFLTPWAAVVQRFLEQTSVMVPRAIPWLQRASLSQELGQEAITRLREAVKTSGSLEEPKSNPVMMP